MTDLSPVDDDGTTGTTVEFLSDGGLTGFPDDAAGLLPLLQSWPHLAVELVDLRPSPGVSASVW